MAALEIQTELIVRKAYDRLRHRHKLTNRHVPKFHDGSDKSPLSTLAGRWQGKAAYGRAHLAGFGDRPANRDVRRHFPRASIADVSIRYTERLAEAGSEPSVAASATRKITPLPRW